MQAFKNNMKEISNNVKRNDENLGILHQSSTNANANTRNPGALSNVTTNNASIAGGLQKSPKAVGRLRGEFNKEVSSITDGNNT